MRKNRVLKKNMKSNRIIERALPLNDNYTFISAKYSPIIDGEACTCDNCGKLISNIATIKNDAGNTFNIGLDCAETLTTLKNNPEFSLHFKTAISEGKRIRSKIVSHLKKNNITGCYIYTNTEKEIFVVYKITRGGSAMEKIIFPEITLKYISEFLTEK